MIVIDKDWQRRIPGQLVATIGFFDGVHLGHRFLIEQLKRTAAELGLPSAVITFKKHPRAVLQSSYQPRLLNSYEEKIEQLATTGIDYCIVLDFTVELSLYSAKNFISHILAEKLQIKALLIGYDHRFGHDRKEGFPQYVTYGRESDMDVIQALPYDQGNTVVSSSEVRRLLSDGEVQKAKSLLTYPYELKGRIVKGHQVGRTLGFPTANIALDDRNKILPQAGVYAVWVRLLGKRYKGMLSIGNRPTLDDGDNQSIEVNILNFSGDIYQQDISVFFIEKVRDNHKFHSLEELKAQLEADQIQVDLILVE